MFVAGAGLVSFGILTVKLYPGRTSSGGFGTANSLTAVRLLCILLLAIWPWSADAASLSLVLIGLLLLVADGIDGWLARRLDQTSEFGEFFDKETDAFFLLVLCLLAIDMRGYTIALIAVGLLRYVFALVLYTCEPPAEKEPRSAAARYLYVTMMAVLLAAFLPIPVLPPVLVGLTAVVLIASFVPYFRWALAGVSARATP